MRRAREPVRGPRARRHRPPTSHAGLLLRSDGAGGESGQSAPLNALASSRSRLGGFDPPGRRGAPAQIPRRQMVNAMLFLARAGCQCATSPNDTASGAPSGSSGAAGVPTASGNAPWRCWPARFGRIGPRLDERDGARARLVWRAAGNARSREVVAWLVPPRRKDHLGWLWTAQHAPHGPPQPRAKSRNPPRPVSRDRSSVNHEPHQEVGALCDQPTPASAQRPRNTVLSYTGPQIGRWRSRPPAKAKSDIVTAKWPTMAGMTDPVSTVATPAAQPSSTEPTRKYQSRSCQRRRWARP